MKKPFPASLRRPALIAVSAGALSVLATTSGCIVVAAGAGAAGVGYVEGAIDSSFAAGFEPSVRATNQAVGQLGFAKVSEKKDALNDSIVLRTGADKRIEIKVVFVTNDITKVTVRVGTFGDQSLSLAIIDKIKSNL